VSGTLLAAFALGLLGSTHCLAMCGGIVGMLTGGIAPDLRRRPGVHLGYAALYNLGRVASYVLFGALFGLLALGLRHAVVETQMVLRGVAGVVMLGLGLHLLGLFPRFTALERVGAPVFARISPVARRLLPVRSHGHALLVGALWGWVPCGMVYTALALATASGRPLDGALAMLAFGVGTLPAMLLSSTVAAQMVARARALWVRRSAGVLIAAFGVMSLSMSAMSVAAASEAHGNATVCHGH